MVNIKAFTITKPVWNDLEEAYAVLEASIRDAFEKEGLIRHHKEMAYEIEHKRNMLVSSLQDTNPDIHFLIAKADDRVIGTISFGPCGNDIKRFTNNLLGSIGEMGSLYVLPEYQDQGIGSALIKAMLYDLNESGVKEFCLDCGYKHAQKKWLRKFGEPHTVVKDYWGKNNDHIIWLCRVRDYLSNGMAEKNSG